MGNPFGDLNKSAGKETREPCYNNREASDFMRLDQAKKFDKGKLRLYKGEI